jgi:SagB-type dehydrogenase family enzyme
MPDLSTSIATHYHQRTKYDPKTIASKNKGLDWSEQPIPFKAYKIGKSYDLTPYLSSNLPDVPDALQWRRLSRLLGCSYGLTAKIPTMGSPVYLRAAPSAGGLYPAEVYLISKGTPLLPPGLYNYQGQTHSLLHFWDSDVWGSLQQACLSHPALENTELAIITTAIFYRSSWRYEDRAYRRICLDTGHLLGNIELACAMTDYRPHLIGGFIDHLLNEMFYFNPQEEGVITVIPLTDLLSENAENIKGLKPTALPSAIKTDYPKIDDGDLLYYFHQATEIKELDPNDIKEIVAKNEQSEDKYNFPFCLKVSTETFPIDWGNNLDSLERTILTRRSTRAYTGEDLTLDELKALLHFTYQPQDYVAQGFDDNPDYFDLSLMETFVAVSGIEGLDSGCYYYAPKAQELRQIRFKNFRRELHYLCLGQDLGRDAGAIIFQTADLQKAVAKYGDRVYRYLHLDAGHLGQRLNLAAIHLKLGVSGIGGFFDDQVNEVLGIPTDEAVIYITTLGRPKYQSMG